MGWPIGTTRREFSSSAKRLATEYDDPDITYGFMVAEKFYHNFYYQDMEDYELDWYPPDVREFVARVLGLLQETKPGVR